MLPFTTLAMITIQDVQRYTAESLTILMKYLTDRTFRALPAAPPLLDRIQRDRARPRRLDHHGMRHTATPPLIPRATFFVERSCTHFSLPFSSPPLFFSLLFSWMRSVAHRPTLGIASLHVD